MHHRTKKRHTDTAWLRSVGRERRLGSKNSDGGRNALRRVSCVPRYVSVCICCQEGIREFTRNDLMVSTARMAASMSVAKCWEGDYGQSGYCVSAQANFLWISLSFRGYVMLLGNCGAQVAVFGTASLSCALRCCRHLLSYDSPKSYSHRHERRRRPRCAQHARQEAG